MNALETTAKNDLLVSNKKLTDAVVDLNTLLRTVLNNTYCIRLFMYIMQARDPKFRNHAS